MVKKPDHPNKLPPFNKGKLFEYDYHRLDKVIAKYKYHLASLAIQTTTIKQSMTQDISLMALRSHVYHAQKLMECATIMAEYDGAAHEDYVRVTFARLDEKSRMNKLIS